MHIKPLIILSFLILLTSCKKTQEETIEENLTKQNTNKGITEQDISKLKYVEYILDSKTEKAIRDWDEFKQLNDVIINIKKGDLTYFIDNKKVVKLLLKELKQNIPTSISSESILSRILVVETKLLQLESLLNLTTTSKKELLENIKIFLIASSNLNYQLNKKVEFDSRTIEKP